MSALDTTCLISNISLRQIIQNWQEQQSASAAANVTSDISAPARQTTDVFLRALSLDQYTQAVLDEGYHFASDLFLAKTAELTTLTTTVNMKPPQARRLLLKVAEEQQKASPRAGDASSCGSPLLRQDFRQELEELRRKQEENELQAALDRSLADMQTFYHGTSLAAAMSIQDQGESGRPHLSCPCVFPGLGLKVI